MQPLISQIDHEARRGSYYDDDVIPSEATPLINRFPQNGGDFNRRRYLFNTAVVGLILVTLLSGIAIGIYLLIQQEREENILPPVEGALQLVSRSQWEGSGGGDRTGTRLSMSASRRRVRRAEHVIAVQTGTPQCWSPVACAHLLTRSNNSEAVKCNFLVSSSGHTFEMLGWRRCSPSFPQNCDTDTALVLGFIGNFTSTAPTRAQFDEAKRFFDESVSQRHLSPTFTVIGKYNESRPTLLYHTLMDLPQWDQNLSDT